MARVTSPEVSGFFLDYHASKGVRFALSAQAAVIKGDALLAVDAVNSRAEFLGGKRLIERGASVAPAALSDMSKPFKEIMTAALA